MARNSTASIEAKALKADVKSEGMRMLYDAGYSVADVTRVFGVGYAFAYGVAKRHNVVATAASRRAVKAPVAKTSTRTARSEARERKVTPAARVATARAKTAPAAKVKTVRAAKTVAVATKPGRPSAARRQVNRKPRTASQA